MEDNASLFQIIKYCFATIMLLYIIRNSIRGKMMMNFIDNFHTKCEKIESKQPKDESNEGKVFVLPIEELINGFGFRFSPETFDKLLSSRTQITSFGIMIFLHLIVGILLAYFIFSVPAMFIAFTVTCLIFLLLIV